MTARPRTSSATGRVPAASTGWPASPGRRRRGSPCGFASTAGCSTGALRWCQMQAAPTNGCYDAETIALDEFGHIQVLNHHVNYSDERDYTDAVVQTFSRTRPKTGWNMHAYGICDTATLQIDTTYDAFVAVFEMPRRRDRALTRRQRHVDQPRRADRHQLWSSRSRRATSLGLARANPIGARTIRLQRRAVGLGDLLRTSRRPRPARRAPTSRTIHVRHGRLPRRLDAPQRGPSGYESDRAGDGQLPAELPGP